MKTNFFAGFFLCCLALASTAYAQGNIGSISVQGTAEIQARPDTALWSITLNDLDMDLQTAKKSNDAKLLAVMKAVDEVDISPEDAQTGVLSIKKEYKRESNGNRGEFIGFNVTRVVSVRQHDLNRIHEFLGDLVAQYDVEPSYTLSISNYEDIRNEARMRAVRVAKEKAQMMAEQVDARLGRALRLSEVSSRYYAPSVSNTVEVRGGGEEMGDFAAGSMPVSVTVAAEFELY